MCGRKQLLILHSSKAPAHEPKARSRSKRFDENGPSALGSAPGPSSRGASWSPLVTYSKTAQFVLVRSERKDHHWDKRNGYLVDYAATAPRGGSLFFRSHRLGSDGLQTPQNVGDHGEVFLTECRMMEPTDVHPAPQPPVPALFSCPFDIVRKYVSATALSEYDVRLGSAGMQFAS